MLLRGERRGDGLLLDGRPEERRTVTIIMLYAADNHHLLGRCTLSLLGPSPWRAPVNWQGGPDERQEKRHADSAGPKRAVYPAA